MIRFDVLGGIALRRDDGPQVDRLLRQPKRLALLAYLAAPTPGTWHRRDTILGLFWPELDSAHARTALRNALYVIRQSLGEQVLINRGDDEISVHPAQLTTDLADLRCALRETRIDAALALYAGELLPGLFVADALGFERWLDGERDRLRREVAEKGGLWVTELEQSGRLTEAQAALRHLVAIHPDDEVQVRRLMALHERMGDPVGGLAAFENYRARLSEDFQAVPAEESLGLAERLRGEATERPSPSGPPTAGGREPPSASPRPGGHPSALALPTSPGTGVLRGAGRWPWVALAAVALLALWWWAPDRTAIPTVGRSFPVTTEEGMQVQPVISPNGRLLAYASGTPQRMRVLVRRLEGGPAWPLDSDSEGFEILPRWSPDNDAVLFLSRNNAYVAPAVGGVPRLVAAGIDAESANVRSASWSPAGDSIAIVRNDSLMVVPLDGIGSRFVGHGSQLHSCVWSPDGRWIACVSGNWVAFLPGTLFGNNAPSAIVMFAASGGEQFALTDAENEHQSPAWAPDSRSLWILSDHDGTRGTAYAIPVGSNGRAGRMIRTNLTAESLSLTPGRIAYSVPTRRANIWSVPIRGGLPVTIAEASRVTSGNQLVEVLHASRDGQWIVFDSDSRGNSDIYRVPTGGGSPERLTDDPRQEFAGDLSPDGLELAYHLWVGGSRRLWVRNLESGVARQLVPRSGDQGVPNWSPNGSAIAVWDHATEPGSVFVVQRDSSGNWGEPLWTLADAQLPVWSPDGRSLTVLSPDGSIDLVEAASGARTARYAPRPGSDDPIATFVARDAGHVGIWFIGHRPSGDGGIWELPPGANQPRLVVDLRDDLGRVNGPALASDGTRLYFTLEERLANVRQAELLAP